MERKYGYKGFKKDMKCRDTQFKEDVNIIYYKDNSKKDMTTSHMNGFNMIPVKDESLEICTSDGYHYCNDVADVNIYYPFKDDPIVYKIEILGAYNDDSNKSITNVFRLVGKVSTDILEEEKRVKSIECGLNLDVYRKLQTANPQICLGGSAALYLHGMTLNRFENNESSDLDIATPYYTILDGDSSIKINTEDDDMSGDDFDGAYILSDSELNKKVKADVRIDPRQPFRRILHNGFSYNVVPWNIIIEAKLRYSMQKGGEKHLKDLEELLNIKKK